jgi:uncharacterized protein YukE
MNRNQQQIYQDVHRICKALEEIVKILKKDEKKISDKDC